LQADGSSQRELLEDVVWEVTALMRRLSRESNVALTGTAAKTPMNVANEDLERIFGAKGRMLRTYPCQVVPLLTMRHSDQHIPLRRATSESEPEQMYVCICGTDPRIDLDPKLTYLSYFDSLGALRDFTDTLIEYAYDQQTQCDPARVDYYLECLQAIAVRRGSEQLSLKIAMLNSQDIVSRRDLTAAYRYFNISPAESGKISDESIRDRFQAQQPDLGPVAQGEARQHLYKLAIHRHSDLLRKVSQQSVDTYDDALSWLGHGVDASTSDEGLLAVFATKVRWSGSASLWYRKLTLCLRRKKKAKPAKRLPSKQLPPSLRHGKARTSTTSSSLASKA
jgi:ubiquitin carboxyl-terminal hydrolase 25